MARWFNCSSHHGVILFLGVSFLCTVFLIFVMPKGVVLFSVLYSLFPLINRGAVPLHGLLRISRKTKFLHTGPKFPESRKRQRRA